MNNDARHIHVQIFLWRYVFIFLEYIPKNGMAGSNGQMVSLCLTFWGTSEVCSKGYYYTIPWAVYRGSSVSTSSQIFIICLSIDSHLCGYKVLSHWSFDLHFPHDQRCGASFHVFTGHLYILYGEMLFRYLMHF